MREERREDEQGREDVRAADEARDGLDVDGVLTDNAIFVGEVAGERVEFKRFDIQDGVGMRLLMWSGLHVAIVSGRLSQATELRAKELGVECYQEADAHKIPAMEALLEKKNLTWEEVAFLGDDIPDLAVLRRVGLPAAVANAIYNATGTRITALPFTPENVYRALHGAAKAPSWGVAA